MAIRRGMDISLLEDIVKLLAKGAELPKKNKDHQLTGSFSGHRECHITPDWLLIYKINNDILILTLVETGTHADIF